MAKGVSKKGRLAVKEQASGWGTAETSFSASDYLEIEGAFIPPLTRETLGVDTFRPGHTAAPKTPGSKAATSFSFRKPLHGWSPTAPGGNPTIHPDATLLKALLGGAGADGYSTTVSGGTAAIPTDTGIPTAHAGFAAAYPLAAGYSIGWNSVVTLNTSSDLLVDLSGSPVAGTALGSYVLWLANTFASTPLTFQWLGSDSTALQRIFDALPSKATITLASKQQPMVDYEVRALNWTNVGSGGAPADFAYGYPQMPSCQGANGFRALFAGGSDLGVRQVVIEITNVFSDGDEASADQGVDSLVIIDRIVRVMVTVNPSDFSADPWTYEAGDATAAFQVDANTTAGRMFSFAMCAPQVADQPQAPDTAGLVGLTYTLEPLIYSGDTGSTAPADVPAKCAFL